MSISTSTRHDSYQAILETLSKRQRVVLNELRPLGEHGITAGELAKLMYDKGIFHTIDRNNVHPRLTEMVEAGYVRVTGKRRCNVTGKTVGVYTYRGYQEPEMMPLF